MKLRKSLHKIQIFDGDKKGQYRVKVFYRLFDNDDQEHLVEFLIDLGENEVQNSITDAMYHAQCVLGPEKGTLDFQMYAEVDDKEEKELKELPEAMRAFALKGKKQFFWEATAVR